MTIAERMIAEAGATNMMIMPTDDEQPKQMLTFLLNNKLYKYVYHEVRIYNITDNERYSPDTINALDKLLQTLKTK